MKAELVNWSSDSVWQKVELEDTLTAFGEVEIGFERLSIVSDKTFSLNGKKVLVYIRDQTLQHHGRYKFHVANCSTIIDFQYSGRSIKYVASIRKDGVFKVNLVSNGKIIEPDRQEELKVCKNCLASLNYKGYSHTSNRNAAVDDFSIDEFFQLYTHQNISTPKYTNVTSRPNEYPPDWTRISESYRQRRNWICENCGHNLRHDKQGIEVHHINGHKAYNRDEDLRALCVRCHANEPGHGHMTQLPKYYEFIRKYPLQNQF